MKNKLFLKTLLVLIGILIGSVTARTYADNYYVRGASPFSWDDGTLMDHSSVSDNVYYLEVYGSREFKIVNAYQGWSCSVNKGSGDVKEAPSDNVTLGGSGNITGGGNYTWYICYDTSDGKVYGTKANPDTPTYPNKYIAGGNANWLSAEWDTDDDMMDNNGDGTYSITVEDVTAVEHQFKITNGSWGDGEIGWDESSTTCTNGTCADGDNNIKFTPYVAGDVTIFYNTSGNVITITCPKIPITLSKNSGASDGSATVDVGASSLSSITHVSRTGYNLTGYWTLTSGGYKVINNDGTFVTYSSNVSTYLNNATPATWKKTSATTLYAQWTPKNYTITIDKNGGTKDGSVQTTYASTTTSSLSAPTWSGYHVTGYYSASTSGTLVMTTAGVLQASVSGFTDSNGKWTATNSPKLYAYWAADAANYTVTYGVHESGHGTLTAVDGDENAITSGADDIAAGTAITFTATPSTYYEVEGWYTDEDCTEDKHDAGETTYSVASLGSDLDVYVKFKLIDYTINYNLYSGTNNPSNPATYTYDDETITLQDPTRDGWKFEGWYAESTFVNKVTSIPNHSSGTKNLYAKWSQKTNSLSVSSSTVYAGSTVRLTATRTNHSLNLTYQYKIGSGAWNNIGTATSSTTKDYEIPYANTYQTYKFRVVSTDGGASITSAEQTVNVKGRITIHVKNTNNWGTMYLYSWYNSDDKTNGNWPGATGTGSNEQSCSIQSAGSQWWNVTITQETSNAQKFILNCNASGNQNQTNDLNLSDFTHNACYAMSTEGSSKQSLSPDPSCPTAPTGVTTTASPSSATNTSMTMAGSIGTNGNDDIFDYGFYWGTTDACGTKAQKGTTNTTGSFNKQITGLTAGTTYYFKAYATNGFGTSYGTVRSYKLPYKVTVTKSTGCNAITPTAGDHYYNASVSIDATGNSGYHFNSWVATGGTLGSATTASTTFTPTADNATLTATFTEFIMTAPSSSRKTLHYAGNPLTISLHSTLPDGCTNVVYSYEYKLSGGSWSALSPASSSVDGGDATCVWNTPSETDKKIYQVRGKLTYSYGGSSHTIYTDASTEITVVGTGRGSKTIKVKKPDEWNTFDGMHLWGSSGIDEIAWPGYSIQFRHIGGKWYEFVIPDVENFILNNGIADGSSNPDKYQTVDLSYADSITNNYCYVLSNKKDESDGKYSPQKTYKYRLIYTANCPAAPTVTASAPTPLTNESATLNGNISSNGNDDITDYGFYWSTDANDDTAAEIAENGTKVQKGTSDKSGGFTHILTVTAGTTYRYIAYATNGIGTTLSTVQTFKAPYKVTISTNTGCSAISPSGENYTSSTISVTATKATGYTFSSWSTTKGTQTSTSSEGNTNTLTFTPSADNATIQPVYTEIMHTVTLANGGHGHVEIGGATVTSASAGIATATSLITAVPDLGYYFTGWTGSDINNGVTIASGSTSTASITIRATADSKTITATFASIWGLYSSINSWGDPVALGNYSTDAGKTYGYVDVDLAANTQYSFKIRNIQTSANYKPSSNTEITYANKATAQTMNQTSSGDPNQTIMTAGKGTYRFTWNATDHSIKVTYPDSYTVTFGQGVGNGTAVTASVESSVAITSGQYAAAGKDITFTQAPATGYTFKGWYTAASGGSAIACMGTSDNVYDDIAANINVYAQYTPKTYAVTFDATTNDGTLSGSSPQNATFDATTIPSCPTATKDGYCFDGWYTAASGGKKVINPDGTLVANVTDGTQYTGAGGAWKKDGIATVYAVFVAPEIELTKSGKGLISSMPGYDTLIINQSFGCTPADDYNISYTVGYAVSHTQLAPQPTIKYCDAAVEGVRHDTIIMPVGDGANSYEVVAYLKTGTTRGSGDSVTVDTIRADVESSYSVRVRAQVDGIDIAEERVALLYPSFAAIHVTIWKEINGYQLDHIDLGVGVTKASTSEEDTYYWNAYYAANASTITAVYKPKTNTVYFLDPDDNRSMYAATRTKLYDYGTGGYWHTSDATQKGAGSYNMTGDTVVATGMGSSVWMASIGGSTTSFAFTSDKHNYVNEFYSYTASNGSKLPAHVIYRTDYNATLPMFVPVAKNSDDCYIINKNGDDGWAQYYRGFWVKRSPDTDSTGYYLKVYNKKTRADAPDANTKDPELIQSVPLRLTQTGEDGTWELTATIDLEANKTYGFKFTKATGANSVVWYADDNQNTMTSAAHIGWDNFVTTAGKSNTGLTTTAAGDYTFHIYCVDYGTKAANAANATDVQGKFAVTVDYAAQSGDYRVIYSDATQTEVIASPSIRPRANGQDTVSFFIRKSDASRVMKIQQFTSSWGDVSTVDLSTIAKDSVYVIYLEQNEAGTSISTTGIDFYDGDYYIRTDCVDKYKWDYKKSLENHRMIPTDYGMTAKQPNKFSHYYVHWLTANSNVKFIVANKYAPCLSDTVITDDWVTDTGGKLGAKGANIRFMYNKGTNEAMRAYLYGSQENDDDYLKLSESTTSGYMKNRSGSTISNITFSDLGNFTYQAEIKARSGLRGKLTAKYLSTTQYFLGSSSSDEELISGSAEEFQNILLTYDFKTNRLICAWQPSGATITEDLNINADILIIRKAQGDAQQIRFSGETKINDVHYIYGVIEFEYSDMYHQLYTWDWWSYSHCMYYISFPFDVLVNDITGAGTLGVDWRIQRYNGAKRAEKGWFADGEKTFWEDIHAGDTLKAYEGYSLLLNRSRFNGTAGDIWANKHAGDKVYLYFPSVSPMIGKLSNQSVTVHVPAHECTKDQTFVNSRGMLVNHKVTDSHWNMIGTPMFADTTAFSIETGPTVSGEKLQYIYAWNYYGNTLGIQLTLDETWRFKTMYSYMAQYCGDIVFGGPAVNKVVAAKRNEEKKNYHLNLELTKDDMFIGRTYVELRENAVDSFMLNEDIYMFRNGVNADLFTYAGTYEAGANVLPIADQIVPVGIAVKKAGTYVFSMPDAFDGEVTLVDNYEQTRTNLMLDDYEIALPTGEITDRFFLEIKINKVPTAIDGVGGGSLKDGKAHKYIENGLMYILQNGVIYDAQGKRVK